jgi:NitT/TauT family transport system permease protein
MWLLEELTTRAHVYAPHVLHDLFIASLAAACAIAAASITAFVVLSNKLIGRAVVAAASVTQALPMVALGPLLILEFGYGVAVKVLIAWLVCFFPVLNAVVETTAGLRSGRDWAGGNLRSSVLDRFWWISLPCVADGVAAGMKTTFVLSVIGAIIADFVNPIAGLGEVINGARASYDHTTMYTAVLLAGALGVAMFGAGGAAAAGARRLVRTISR